MYADYIQRMLEFRDYAAPLAAEFGIPTLRSLILRNRSSKEVTYLEIKPLPAITTVHPEPQDLINAEGVSLATQTFEVKGVSRAYTRSQLFGSRVDYVIDATIQNNFISGGIFCNLISITENTLTWNLVLRQKIGEEKLY